MSESTGTKRGFVQHDDTNQGQAPMYTGFMIQGLMTTVEVVEKQKPLDEESEGEEARRTR